MRASTERTGRSIFAIAMAAILRVLLSSPRVMAGEVPPVEQGSRSGLEFQSVADDILREASTPNVESRRDGSARINVGSHRFTSPEISGLLKALNTEVMTRPPDGSLFIVLPAAAPTSAVAAIMTAWFRRAPAAAT